MAKKIRRLEASTLKRFELARDIESQVDANPALETFDSFLSETSQTLGISKQDVVFALYIRRMLIIQRKTEEMRAKIDAIAL